MRKKGLKLKNKKEVKTQNPKKKKKKKKERDINIFHGLLKIFQSVLNIELWPIHYGEYIALVDN